MYATATNSAPGVLTLDTMLTAVAKAQAAMSTDPKPDFGPITMIENPLATRTHPVKVHKHRRTQTKAYHQRIQKKWTKRYGTKQVPCVYMFDNAYLGGFGRTLVAHPSLMAGLRHSVEIATPKDVG